MCLSGVKTQQKYDRLTELSDVRCEKHPLLLYKPLALSKTAFTPIEKYYTYKAYHKHYFSNTKGPFPFMRITACGLRAAGCGLRAAGCGIFI